MRIPGPKSILGAGGLTLGIGGVLRSREKKKAKQRVDEFKSDEVKDWDRFTDHAARKSFVQQLGSDPTTDPKLLQYADNMNRLKTGSKITSLPGDAGKSYQITKLRGSERLGCTCNDWRYKKSVAQPGEEQDCKHIKQYRQMSKTAASTYEEEGSFTHAGKRYSLQEAFRFARTQPTKQIPVDDLKWVLAYDRPDPARLAAADLTAPVLVAPDQQGRPTVVDGLHRLSKAVREGRKTIPAKVLPLEALKTAGLTSPKNLTHNQKQELQKLLIAADEHPEFKGYGLVQGAQYDKRRQAIVSEEGKVVGFMTPRKDGEYWRTGAIFTDPAERGKGHAHRAISEFFSDIRRRPGRVWIAENNNSSRKAFQAAGFQEGKEHNMGGDRGNFFIMQKEGGTAAHSEKTATELRDVPWSERKDLLERTLLENLKGVPADDLSVEARRGFGFLAPNAEIRAKKQGENIFDEDNIFSQGAGAVSLRKDIFRPRWEMEADALYLKPEYQGKGIGGSIFKGMMRAAKDLGVDKVTLEADDDGKVVWAKMPGVQFQKMDRIAVAPAYALWKLRNKGPEVPAGSPPSSYPEEFLRSWSGAKGTFIGYEIPVKKTEKTAAANFRDKIPPPEIGGKPHSGPWAVVGSGRLGIPKKTSDIDYMVPLEEVKDLSSFQEYKGIPGVYWRDSETIDGRPSTIVALPRYAYDKIDASYQQATDRFGKRKLRQMRKTLPKDSFYKDIGVVFTSDAMKKQAGHVEDRIAERAPGAESEVTTLRAKLRQIKLRKGQTYHVPLSRGKGYAVIGDVGDHHAVKTVLGPNMRPPGERLKLARAPRDYAKEYAQYHSKPEQVENRSLRNQARRKLGLKKGDPREVDHKTPLAKGGGNGHGNLRAVSRTTNRTKFTGEA